MIRSDAWDSGNAMTRFYAASEKQITCPACNGRKRLTTRADDGRWRSEECPACEGTGSLIVEIESSR